MLHSSPELKLCADAHEEEVITKDSYEIKALAEKHPDIEYIVDIGGNIGAFSKQVSNFFPSAKVILCEPEPELMKYAKLNTDNKLIYVEKAVVGDPDLEEVQFSVCKWQGNHHVKGKFRMDTYGVPSVGSKILHDITVKATTLPQIISANNFPRIDLLKVDTEGSEPDIFKSIKPWLKNVKHIVAEWHSQDDLRVLLDVIKDTHNYTLQMGFFKETNGAVANGGLFAELKE